MGKIDGDTLLVVGAVGLGAYLIYTLKKPLQNTFEGVGTAASGLGAGITEIAGGAGQAAEGIGGGISTAFTGAGYGIDRTLRGAGNFGETTFNAAGQITSQTGSSASEILKIPQIIAEGINNPMQEMNTGNTALMGIYADTSKTIRKTAAQVITPSNIKAGISAGAQAVSKTIRRIETAPANALKSANQATTRTISNIKKDVEKTAQAAATAYNKTAPIDTAKHAVLNVVSKAKSFLKKVLRK